MKFYVKFFLVLLGYLICASVSCSSQSSHNSSSNKRFQETNPYKTIGGEEFRFIPDSLSADRKLIAVRSKDETIKILRLDDEKELCELENSAITKTDDVVLRKCALSPENRNFVAQIYFPHRKYDEASNFGTSEVWFWSTESGKLMKKLSVKNGGGEFQYSADGSTFVLNYGNDTGINSEIRIYSTQDDKLLQTINTYIFSTSERRGFEISPNGEFIASLDQNINIWSGCTSELLFTFKTEPNSIYALLGWTFSPDSKELIHFNETHIYKHSLETGELNSEQYIFDSYQYMLHPIAFNADGNLLAVGLSPVGDISFGKWTCRILFFSLETGNYMGDIFVPSDELALFVFSPDGKYLFTSDYKTLRLYEVPQLTNSWMEIFKTKQGIPKNINSNKPSVWTTERVQSSG